MSIRRMRWSSRTHAEAGYEIVPTTEARALVAYLLSLRAETPLFDAPLTAPAAAPGPATNAPAK